MKRRYTGIETVLWLVFACIVGIANAGLANGASLSYEDARSVLHGVSDLQQSAEAGVSRRDYEARAADSLGLPEVSVGATEIFGIKTGSLPTPLGIIDVNLNFRGPRSSINSTWSIYTGGRIEATQRALAAGTDQARAELTGTEEQLDLQLTQVYFGVELAANVERTRTLQLRDADDHLGRALKFEQRGVIAKVERLNAQVARDEAARELVRAKREREIAQARLQRLLRRDVQVEPSTPLFVITNELKPLSDWLSAAERQSPVLAAFDAKREQAKQGIVIAESRWKPEVFAFGTYSFMRNYQTIIEPNWIAGIGVRYTLFSREDRASKVSAAREELRQVQGLEAETRNDIDSAVETAYRKVAQAREQFLLLDSSLVAARENLRLRERGFEEGQATSLDVNDARNAVVRAETSRAQAAYEFVVALAQLLEASGQAHALAEYIQVADVQLRL
ncbi:MAG TPA: TolC family protein [Casimicrobiaceae bacterium]|nr:TolC family protein [Casimicrobiaceae bacterium]